MPLNFKNDITKDALVDSSAYVSAIARNKFDRIKQQGLGNIIKINDPPDFQSQVVNGCLEKPISTVTLEFDIGDLTFAETVCRDEVFYRADQRCALHETQQSNHRHNTWPHPFSTLDNANQKHCE